MIINIIILKNYQSTRAENFSTRRWNDGCIKKFFFYYLLAMFLNNIIVIYTKIKWYYCDIKIHVYKMLGKK